MATFRVGVGSFNIKDGTVGIGTEGSGHGNLKVEGTARASAVDVVGGASTFTRYSGFSANQVSVNDRNFLSVYNTLDKNNRILELTGEVQTTGDIIVDDRTVLKVGLGSTACVGSLEYVCVKNHFSVPTGGTNQRNSSVYVEGTIRYNTDLGTMEFFNGNEWRQFTYITDVQNSPSSRGRGLIIGGVDGTGNTISNIQSFQIATLGNTVQFGNLQSTKSGATANASDGVRGITFGGATPSDSNEIDYYTYASGGTAIDFGNTTDARYSMGGVSSSTRGLAAGGWTPNNSNAIDYVEIQTLGDALDFGDLSEGGNHGNPGMQSPTRGIFCGGYGSFTPDTNSPYAYNRMQMVTIASKGNTTDFGNLIVGGARGGAGGNSVRGVYGGGYYNGINSRIEFITLASEGNASYFGDLTVARRNCAEVSDSSTRAVFCGGIASDGTAPAATNYMDYITIASAGNALDFGDVTGKIKGQGGFSDSHGGLGGY